MLPARLIMLLTCLGLALSTAAQAGPRHDDRPGYRGDHRGEYRSDHRHRPPAHGHYGHPPRHGHGHSYSYRRWVAPAAVVTLGALTIGSTFYPPPPRVIHVPPAPPNGQWYFCRSSGQYYPYTQACPEGWLAVSPE